MSITQDEATQYWDGSKGIEFNYFEMGFEKAIEVVGNCWECEYYKNKDYCPMQHIEDIEPKSFYCASFDKKEG